MNEERGKQRKRKKQKQKSHDSMWWIEVEQPTIYPVKF
jgi:hypothetical protein